MNMFSKDTSIIEPEWIALSQTRQRIDNMLKTCKKLTC